MNDYITTQILYSEQEYEKTNQNVTDRIEIIWLYWLLISYVLIVVVDWVQIIGGDFWLQNFDLSFLNKGRYNLLNFYWDQVFETVFLHQHFLIGLKISLHYKLFLGIFENIRVIFTRPKFLNFKSELSIVTRSQQHCIANRAIGMVDDLNVLSGKNSPEHLRNLLCDREIQFGGANNLFIAQRQGWHPVDLQRHSYWLARTYLVLQENAMRFNEDIIYVSWRVQCSLPKKQVCSPKAVTTG